MIYLAGPHMDDAFREKVSPLLRAVGLEPFDPIAARDFRGREVENEVVIVEGDLADIRRCRAVLGNYSTPGWGTGMETWEAHRLGKPIVAYVEPGLRVSPWVAYVAGGWTNVERQLSGAVERVVRALGALA